MRELRAVLAWGVSAGTARYLLRNVQTRTQMAAFAVLVILYENLADAGDAARVGRTAQRIGATSIAIVSVRWALEGLGPEKRPFSLPALFPRAFRQSRRAAVEAHSQRWTDRESGCANEAHQCTGSFAR